MLSMSGVVTKILSKINKKKLVVGGCQFVFIWMTCITDRLLSSVTSIEGTGEKVTFSGSRPQKGSISLSVHQ